MFLSSRGEVILKISLVPTLVKILYTNYQFLAYRRKDMDGQSEL